MKEECPQLSLIIVFEENVSEEDRKNAEEADIKILTMREVEVYKLVIIIYYWILFNCFQIIITLIIGRRSK